MVMIAAFVALVFVYSLVSRRLQRTMLTGPIVFTTAGALQVTGQGQWVGPTLRFRGEAAAADDAEQALNNLLNIIGRRQGKRSIITIG